jgi:hypothetical protein
MDKMENTHKTATTVSKKDVFEIILLMLFVSLWALIGF